jgi:hypothetical protein
MPSFYQTAVALTLTLIPSFTLAVPHGGGSSFVSSMPKNAQGLLAESMAWMDEYYDSDAGYLYNLGATSALRHETRSSAWYATGLLARNQGNDAKEANKIIANVISGQYDVPSEQWYVKFISHVNACRFRFCPVSGVQWGI